MLTNPLFSSSTESCLTDYFCFYFNLFYFLNLLSIFGEGWGVGGNREGGGGGWSKPALVLYTKGTQQITAYFQPQCLLSIACNVVVTFTDKVTIRLTLPSCLRSVKVKPDPPPESLRVRDPEISKLLS